MDNVNLKSTLLQKTQDKMKLTRKLILRLVEEKLYGASLWGCFVWNASSVPIYNQVGASHFMLRCADLMSKVWMVL